MRAKRRQRHKTLFLTEGGLKKESQDTFFGEAKGKTFFQPVQHTASSIQRKCAECGEKEKVQRKGSHVSLSSGVAPPQMTSLNGKGKPLSGNAQQFFGQRMGYDFSNVNIHTGSEAEQSAGEINAKAYTIGNDIVFNAGQYNTTSSEGKKLLAHELAHVVQQGSSAAGKKTIARKADFDKKGKTVYDIDAADQIVNLLNGTFSYMGDTQMVVNGTAIEAGKAYTGKDNPLDKPGISSSFDSANNKYKCSFNSEPTNKLSFLIHLPNKKKWSKKIDIKLLSKMDDDIKASKGDYFFKYCKNKTIQFEVTTEAGSSKSLSAHENVHASHVEEAFKDHLEPWDTDVKSRIGAENGSSTKAACEKTLYASMGNEDKVMGKMIKDIDKKGKDFHKTAKGEEMKLKSVKEVTCDKLVVVMGYSTTK